jgi:hypothetical protein
MKEKHTEIEIQAPAERVWTWFRGHEPGTEAAGGIGCLNDQEWMRGIDEMRPHRPLLNRSC